MKYECVEKTVLVRICEGRSQLISCPAPKKIDITSANYGRLTGPHLCPGPVKTTNCGAAGSIDIVRNKCQGKQSCFFAGNKRPVWRSLCWDKEVFGGDYGSDPLPKSNLFCFGKICKNNMFLFQYIGEVRMCGKKLF